MDDWMKGWMMGGQMEIRDIIAYAYRKFMSQSNVCASLNEQSFLDIVIKNDTFKLTDFLNFSLNIILSSIVCL